MTGYRPPSFDRPPDWMDRAACIGTPAHIFFPDVTEPEGPAVERARQVCEECAVQPECLAYVLHIREPYGFWGGQSEGERRATLRAAGEPRIRPKPIDHGTYRGYAAHHRRGEEPCPSCKAANNRRQEFARTSRAAAS